MCGGAVLRCGCVSQKVSPTILLNSGERLAWNVKLVRRSHVKDSTGAREATIIHRYAHGYAAGTMARPP